MRAWNDPGAVRADRSSRVQDSDVAASNSTADIRKIGQNGLNYQDDINMKSTNSNFGIKGEEDLGNRRRRSSRLSLNTTLPNPAA